MTEVDVVSEEENEEQLAHVLLLLVAVQRLVTLELGPDVGELLVDTLHLRLLALAVAYVGDEDGQAAHAVTLHRRHGEGFPTSAARRGNITTKLRLIFHFVPQILSYIVTMKVFLSSCVNEIKKRLVVKLDYEIRQRGEELSSARGGSHHGG